MLLVLLTLSLFVGCDGSAMEQLFPKETPEEPGLKGPNALADESKVPDYTLIGGFDMAKQMPNWFITLVDGASPAISINQIYKISLVESYTPTKTPLPFF